MGMMGGAAGGQRVVFSGDGGKLFGTYLLYLAVPIVVAAIVFAIISNVGAAIDRAAGTGGMIAIPAMLLGVIVLVVVELGAIVMFTNKFNGFYHESLMLDGQPCQYTGTPGELAKIMVINAILTNITCGIYTPWAMVRMKQFVDSKLLVNGQPNRVTFHGDPASLLGTYILGAILTSITCGIYGPWFANDLFAFMWENTKLDGRPYQFRKDPGGFFGTYLLNIILSYITCGIYTPWAICNILKWEADRVA